MYFSWTEELEQGATRLQDEAARPQGFALLKEVGELHRLVSAVADDADEIPGIGPLFSLAHLITTDQLLAAASTAAEALAKADTTLRLAFARDEAESIRMCLGIWHALQTPLPSQTADDEEDDEDAAPTSDPIADAASMDQAGREARQRAAAAREALPEQLKRLLHEIADADESFHYLGSPIEDAWDELLSAAPPVSEGGSQFKPGARQVLIAQRVPDRAAWWSSSILVAHVVGELRTLDTRDAKDRDAYVSSLIAIAGALRPPQEDHYTQLNMLPERFGSRLKTLHDSLAAAPALEEFDTDLTVPKNLADVSPTSTARTQQGFNSAGSTAGRASDVWLLATEPFELTRPAAGAATTVETWQMDREVCLPAEGGAPSPGTWMLVSMHIKHSVADGILFVRFSVRPALTNLKDPEQWRFELRSASHVSAPQLMVAIPHALVCSADAVVREIELPPELRGQSLGRLVVHNLRLQMR